jgi:hypothetical protein
MLIRDLLTIFSILILMKSSLYAVPCGQLAINPTTGQLDCVGTPLPTNGTSGQCLTFVSFPPLVVQWSACGSTGTVTDDLILEDGTYFLLEDGNKLHLEP